MFSHIKRLTHTTFVYGLGKLSLYFIGFLLVPIYTRIFTPADYGIIELVNITMFLLGVLTVAGTDSAQTFYFYQKPTEGDEETHKSQLVAASMQRIFISGLFWTAIFLLTWQWLSPLLYENEVPFIVLAVALVGMMLNQLQNNVINVFRLTYRPWLYVMMTFFSGLFSALFSILFIVVLRIGIPGVFLGSALGGLAALAGGLWGLRRVFPKGIPWHIFSFKWLIKLTRFGLPLVPGALLIYVMSTADRWFIHHFLDTSELGIFSLSAKYSSILFALVSIFRLGFVPLATEVLQRSSQEMHRFFETTFRYYVGSFACLSLVFTAAAPMALRLLAPPAYYQAAQYVGWAMIPAVLDGVFFFSVLGTWKAEKTIFNTVASGSGAILDLSLNFVMIPHLGILGALLSSAIGALTQIILGFIISQRLYPIHFPFKRFVLQLFLWLSALTLYWFSTAANFLSLPMMIIILLLFTIGTAAITIKPAELRFAFHHSPISNFAWLKEVNHP